MKKKTKCFKGAIYIEICSSLEMCERALDHNHKLLRFFPNCFVTLNILDNFDNDNPVVWYIGRQERKLLSTT